MNASGRIKVLEERVKKLEAQRQTWWRRAWYAHSLIERHDKTQADELVEGWDREEPKT